MKRLAIIATVLLLSCVGAAADPGPVHPDGNTLLRRCAGAEGLSGRLFCVAYLLGVQETFDAMRDINGVDPCRPQAVTLDQVKDVVIRYLKENPEKRDFPAVLLVVTATRETWCPANPLKDESNANYR
jgi:hypothetical protein